MGEEIIIFKCPHCDKSREIGRIYRDQGFKVEEHELPCIGGCKEDEEEEI